MGVSGCGKSTTGRLLAGELGLPFFDADDFHSPANIERMRNGLPLDDAHRAPWLETLHQFILAEEARAGLVLACSALKESYRRVLTSGVHNPQWIYLRGTRELLFSRLTARTDHFMSATLLDSQLDTLEEPSDAIVAEITRPPEILAKEIAAKLRHKHQDGLGT